MEFSIKRVNALFKKEVKDFGKNVNVSIMCILPIMFSFIYSKLLGSNSSSKSAVIIMCLGINLTLVSSFIIAMLIAEEKEKNTLRTLMLSAVSPWEFLAGKAFITLLISVIINVAMFFIVGIQIQYLGKYILLSTLVVISMIEIGAIIGLVSPNQMATGVSGTPVLMIFFILPMFAQVNKTLKTIAEFLPNYNMNLLLHKVFSGESIGTGEAYNIAVILVWIIIAAVVFMCTYAKRGLDK